MVTKYKKCLMEFMCMKNYKTINFIDENISHAKTWKYGSIMCGCRVGEEELHKYYIPPNNIWVKKEKEFFHNEFNSGISVFSDQTFHNVNKYESNYTVALILEPPIEARDAYERILQYEKNFDFIFTFEKQLLERNPEKYKFMPADFVTLQDEVHFISDKSKNISMVYSGMRGHNRDLRHQVACLLAEKIDLYGGGSPSGHLNFKSDSLMDYRFSIVIENSIPFDYYFTEKILDCFIVGNIPIYNGTKSIGNFFDKRGFFTWTTIDELNDIVNNVSVEDYEKMLPYIQTNYELAKKYVSADDVMTELIYSCLENPTTNTMENYIYKWR